VNFGVQRRDSEPREGPNFRGPSFGRRPYFLILALPATKTGIADPHSFEQHIVPTVQPLQAVQPDAVCESGVRLLVFHMRIWGFSGFDPFDCLHLVVVCLSCTGCFGSPPMCGEQFLEALARRGSGKS